MTLRDYQQKAVEAILESWKTHQTCVVVLPTGCGKTVVFAEVIRRRLAAWTDPGGKTTGHAMVLAHREELVRQAQDKITSLARVDVAVEMGAASIADFFGELPPVVVSSVQTQRTGRMRKFDPDDFQTLVIDEAHHATASSYVACTAYYLANPDCRLLGVTATPDRADETALGKVFEDVAFSYGVLDAINDGWLVPVKQKVVTCGKLDFSGVSTTAGDFNQAELAEVLEDEQNLHAVAVPTVDICGPRRAIVFAASVKQAERLCEIFNRLRGDSAAWVCGATEKTARKDILKNFSDGKTQFVVNVGVLTEGFDDAGVEVVVMARPTKSRALYAQMAGRATRPHGSIAGQLGTAPDAAARRRMIADSPKPSCLIIDFAGNAGRHKLISTADILGGKEDGEDEQEARRIARKKCEDSTDGVDMAEALEDARAEIVARKLADENARKFIVAKAKYLSVSVDPFDLFELAPDPGQITSPNIGRRLTPRQSEVLWNHFKISASSVTPAQGRLLLDEVFRRQREGLATCRQSNFLRRKGVPVPMSWKEAHETIGRIIDGRYDDGL